MLKAASNILYVRAALKPLARPIKKAGGLIQFLRQNILFNEILAPHFNGARPFWRKPVLLSERHTNSGPLGKLIAKLPEAVVSAHPSHAFVGVGERVAELLSSHDENKASFYPLQKLVDEYDFSMLLLGCLDESPGFSTVHVAQHCLGLSQRHLIRFLLRWDWEQDGKLKSKIAPEAPGCSLSFNKFYVHYEKSDNLIRGQWEDVDWIFIPSARNALKTEMNILREYGRFVDCGSPTCLTCRLRLY